MSRSLTFQSTVSGEMSSASSITVSADTAVNASPASVLAAQAGNLTTRTSDTVGTLTLGASHGIITGQRIDIYWVGGTRYGVTVGTVAGTSVPISLGAGDNLPADEFAVIVGIAEQSAFMVDGDDVTALALAIDGAKSRFVFTDAADAALATFLITAGGGYEWKGTGQGTNPLAGLLPTKVWISHDDVAAAHTGLKASALVA